MMEMVLVIGFALSVIVFHVFAIRRQPVATLVTKAIASLFFVAIGVDVLCYDKPWFVWWRELQGAEVGPSVAIDGFLPRYSCILVGLVLGMVGDVLLAFRRVFPQKRKQYIGAGMVAFGLGHLAYSIIPAIALFGVHPVWLAIPIAVAVIVALGNTKVAPKLGLEYGRFTVPVFVYCTIILFLLITTLLSCIFLYNGTLHPAFPMAKIVSFYAMIPITLFTVSDFVLNTNYFAKEQTPMGTAKIIVVHVTYYLAQFLFALGYSIPWVASA